MPGSSQTALIADIGGTNARFALCTPGEAPHDMLELHIAESGSMAETVHQYLDQIKAEMPKIAAFAIAAPVTGDLITWTNRSNFSFSIKETKDALKLSRFQIANDLAAAIMAIPLLRPEDTETLAQGEAQAPARAVCAMVGVGTGLGTGTLVDAGDRLIPVSGEGGHATMFAANEEESEIIARLRREHGHVSAERLISGIGLPSLYRMVAEIMGMDPPVCTPAKITDMAQKGECRAAVRTMEIFSAMLGGFAGNFALGVGALGGVYLTGGILPKLGEVFHRELFLERFKAKGRFDAYLSKIPVKLITHAQPGLLGLSNLLAQPVQ